MESGEKFNSLQMAQILMHYQSYYSHTWDEEEAIYLDASESEEKSSIRFYSPIGNSSSTHNDDYDVYMLWIYNRRESIQQFARHEETAQLCVLKSSGRKMKWKILYKTDRILSSAHTLHINAIERSFFADTFLLRTEAKNFMLCKQKMST